MTPDLILAHPARVLTQAQRRHYFATGYLAAGDPAPCPVPLDWARQGYGSVFTARKAVYAA